MCGKVSGKHQQPQQDFSRILCRIYYLTSRTPSRQKAELGFMSSIIRQSLLWNSHRIVIYGTYILHACTQRLWNMVYTVVCIQTPEHNEARRERHLFQHCTLYYNIIMAFGCWDSSLSTISLLSLLLKFDLQRGALPCRRTDQAVVPLTRYAIQAWALRITGQTTALQALHVRRIVAATAYLFKLRHCTSHQAATRLRSMLSLSFTAPYVARTGGQE